MGVAHYDQKGGERDTMCTGTHDYIPAEKVIEARMQFSTPGGVAENVLHYKGDDAPTLVGMAQLGDILSDWWNSEIRPGVPTVFALERIILTDLTTATGSQLEYVTGLPRTGSSAAAALPDNVTVAITKLTDHRGRSYRGRIFQIGLGRDQVVGDTLIAGLSDGFVLAYQAIRSVDITTDTLIMQVVSYCQDGAWLEVATVTPVTAFRCDDTVDSQRRRLAGRGA